MDTWTKYIKQVSSNIRQRQNRTLISETKETKIESSTISSAFCLGSISGPQRRENNPTKYGSFGGLRRNRSSFGNSLEVSRFCSSDYQESYRDRERVLEICLIFP